MSRNLVLKVERYNVHTPRRVQTLLSYLPPHSTGLTTSLVGRLIYLLTTTALALVLLHTRPVAYEPHLGFLLAYLCGIYAVGAARILLRRATIMLLFACTMIAIVNAALPALSASLDLDTRLRFGLTRGLAFASLSFATLFVASITRPSDCARFVNRFSSNPSLLCLIAIPFAAFGLLIASYKDTILVNRARLRALRWHIQLHRLVIDVASSLLATVLTRSLYLYQTAYAFPKTATKILPSNLLRYAPFISLSDLLFVMLVVPGILVAILL